MYHFFSLCEEQLSHDELLQFSGLTHPNLRPLIHSPYPKQNHFIYAATYFDRPIGLILAHILKPKLEATLLSLYVDPLFRRRGIATKLLSNFENVMKKFSLHKVHLRFFCEESFPTYLESFLRHVKWPSPKLHNLYYGGPIMNLKQAAWVKRYSLPQQYRIIPWSEITHADREKIRFHQEDTLWYPPALDPFYTESKLEPLNTLCLRDQDEIIGWVMTEKLSLDTIRYHSLFIRKDLEKRAYGVYLLAEALMRQLESPIPFAIFETLASNERMIQFTKKRLMPFCDRRGRIYHVTKDL